MRVYENQGDVIDLKLLEGDKITFAILYRVLGGPIKKLVTDKNFINFYAWSKTVKYTANKRTVAFSKKSNLQIASNRIFHKRSKIVSFSDLLRES